MLELPEQDTSKLMSRICFVLLTLEAHGHVRGVGNGHKEPHVIEYTSGNIKLRNVQQDERTLKKYCRQDTEVLVGGKTVLKTTLLTPELGTWSSERWERFSVEVYEPGKWELELERIQYSSSIINYPFKT